MEHEAELAVDGLLKRYGSASTVGPFSFEVRRGEFFSILGPSGCGKTTLLRCITGFETASAGSIALGGRQIGQVPPNKRDIGLVFQNYALFPHLTVFRNVAFGLRLRKVGKEETARRVAAALALVGLEGFAERLPAQLSGGQQQRVAIARAMVLEPRLMLFDEPLSSLDLKLRVQMRQELRELQRRLGMTALYVTHDQSEALALSDRIAVLSPRGIEQVGTPEDVYLRPRTLFVAEFIGSSNVLRGEVAGDALLLASGDRLRLGGGHTSGAMLAVVRPERVRLLPVGTPAPEAATEFQGNLRSAVFLGEDMELEVALPWTDRFRISKKSGADGLGGMLPQPGAPVRIAIPAAAIHAVEA